MRQKRKNKLKDKICQSCGMPITSEDQFGTNKDKSINADFCKYCYVDGEFVDKVSMEEYIEMCAKFGAQAGMTNARNANLLSKPFPNFKKMEE